MFNIRDFKNEGLKFGGARASLFDVSLPVPPGVISDLRKLTFTCRAASIPAATIGQIDVPYFGRKIKLAGDRVFADWSVTVMNDEDYSVRKLFEQWSNLINNHEENIKTIPLNEYKTRDAEVVHWGKDRKAIALYIFQGLFPTEISAMELDWDTTNAIQTFNVNFAYDYWTSPGFSAYTPNPVIA